MVFYFFYFVVVAESGPPGIFGGYSLLRAAKKAAAGSSLDSTLLFRVTGSLLTFGGGALYCPLGTEFAPDVLVVPLPLWYPPLAPPVPRFFQVYRVLPPRGVPLV